ncbi:hypothetical protein BLA24_00175 [Streptomyces cinnamoneus]|uniref:Uncharacterized protein n=1 Tax=Streptomyces cinnamoneus TaxID=53446 RepID=A0A2G1XQR4_STRCJ|nr:hypothetical protein BLA24_00175 [Streptomyces cinnamoneus]
MRRRDRRALPEVAGENGKTFKVSAAPTSLRERRPRPRVAFCSTTSERLRLRARHEASTDDLYKFVDTSRLRRLHRPGLEQFTPYYYQAGTELGSPSPKFAHLKACCAIPTATSRHLRPLTSR